MNGQNRNIKLYNILLPLWLIIFLPSWLWLLLIPANYLIDRVVLRWSLRDMEDKGLFCRKHNWKICLAGFLSDFAGCVILLGTAILFSGESGNELYDKIFYGIYFNPFSNVAAFAIVAAAVAVSGVCIYYLDRFILKKAGLDAAAARRSALRLALITAPYLFFFPSYLLYEGGF